MNGSDKVETLAMSLLESYNATMQSSLPDHEMEMVSDTEQAMQYGNEIDLDLDLNPESMHPEDEDYMLEDATPEAHFSPSNEAAEEVRDDMMYDEDETRIHQVTSPHDEELRDIEEPTGLEDLNAFAYTGNDLSNPQHNQFFDDHPQTQSKELEPESRRMDGSIRQESTADLTQSQQTIDLKTEPPSASVELTNEEVNDEQEHDQAISEIHYKDDAEASDGAVVAVEEQGSGAVNGPAAETGPGEVQDETVGTDTPRTQHLDAIEHSTQENPTLGPSDVNSPDNSRPLPPVILAYLDNEMTLFPPSSDDTSSTYFLEDESLSEQSMKDIFHAIRKVLGESIGEDEDLRLHIHDFNLDLDEVSPFSYSRSLPGVLTCSRSPHIFMKSLCPRYDSCMSNSRTMMELKTLVRFI